jgi:S1-C subfamily serine protease
MDLSVELIHATVQIEQKQPDQTRTVGTGFLIADVDAEGRPRTVLVTANHVLAGMPGADAKIGYRIAKSDGGWSFTPANLRIRDEQGRELWTRHPARDVAAMVIVAPAEFAKAAIPPGYLATDETFSAGKVATGDEMLALGFPRGLSANAAGFPILRSGRVASFPLSPPSLYPTFLLDFSVFPGNSGGPVFVTAEGLRQSGAEPTDTNFIAGLLTQQVELNRERLAIGIVTHAKYIRETLSLVRSPAAPLDVALTPPATDATAVSADQATKSD